ncbi:MAG: hypothetical protein KDA77_23440, partial [Planctomycetaceae bacterium]|nr:hypothetical protein [Planctomycetaceae bacterium]
QMAHATCGDYLSHAGQVDSSDLILMFRPDQSPPKFPCSGPECQNHRPDPMPETPLIVITTIKPAYSVSSEMTFPPIPQCATRDSQSLLLTSACRQRIDRPPQTSGF